MSSSNRVRFVGVALLLMAGRVGYPARADDPENARPGVKNQPGDKEIALSISPAAISRPVFRHRLLPMASKLNPGDAAPLYLRIGHELSEGELRKANKEADTWLALPFAKFPATDARALVNQWSDQLRQIEFGAHRQTCDWNYSLPEERDHILTIRLPDAQTMRIWGRLLAVKARVEIAEGKYDDAIQTVETGVAFGQHVARTPFYVNVLVGIAITNLMLDRVDDLISRPNTSNLYWALTALPRPLISIRDASEGEQMVGEWIVPEITEVDRPQTDAEWAALLSRLHSRLVALSKLLSTNGSGLGKAPAADLGTFKATMLTKARDYLKERSINARSDDQAIVLAMVGNYRELYDDYFKRAYLAYPDAIPLEQEGRQQVIATKGGPASVFAELLPNIQSLQIAEVRLDRKVAALRIVEALRMYLATNDGRLPESLDQVKGVPLPSDPMTGQPFEYRREGESAVLTGKASMTIFRLNYRITGQK